MTTIELNKHLIQRIAQINDDGFLKAIKTILDSKSNSELVNLTQEQKEDIYMSREQISQGLFIGEEELDKEIEQWLSEK